MEVAGHCQRDVQADVHPGIHNPADGLATFDGLPGIGAPAPRVPLECQARRHSKMNLCGITQ